MRKASLSITEKTGKFQSKTRKSQKAGTSMIEHGFSGLAQRIAKDQATHIVHPDCRREETEGECCESAGLWGLCFRKITTNPKIHLEDFPTLCRYRLNAEFYIYYRNHFFVYKIIITLISKFLIKYIINKIFIYNI